MKSTESEKRNVTREAEQSTRNMGSSEECYERRRCKGRESMSRGEEAKQVKWS